MPTNPPQPFVSLVFLVVKKPSTSNLHQCPSSVSRTPSSVFHPPSSVLHPPSSVFRPPSPLKPFVSLVFLVVKKPSNVKKGFTHAPQT